MPVSVTPAIPASQIVDIRPSVLSAGGTALDLIGLILTKNTRPPIGEVLSFSDETDVADFFGAGSQEDALSTIYFNAPSNSTISPAALLFAQYPEAAVSAYLRGGVVSGMTLTALQALSGTLVVAIDGVTKTANSVNLAAATSFSNAAEILADDLAIEGVQAATFTASIGGTFTGSATGTTLTVTAVLTGTLQVGDVVSGTDATNSLQANTTIVSQLTGTTGGTGTYQLSLAPAPGPMASTTVTALSTVLDVTAVATGALGVGDQFTGTGITAGTYVASQISGTTGGAGLYAVSVGHTHASEAMTAFSPAVQYDSILGTFVILSGTTGATSTLAYATGTLAGALKLNAINGAVLSQGAAAATPVAFMDGVVEVTQNWAEFMTAWEPSDANKERFADWVNGKNNRYVYEMWDTAVADTQVNGPSPPVAYVNTGSLSGVVLVYEDPAIDTVGGELAAFGMGYTASLDFSRLNGRRTQAFRTQSGLAPQIIRATPATQLIAHGMNFLGDYTTANDEFKWYYPGSISGPFKWKDSYVNQIWLNNQLQLAIMVGLGAVNSVPYNAVGRALISGWCRDPILAAVNFGAIVAGVNLSEAQKVEVNNAAGIDIDKTITNQGWYLQVGLATPQVRAARGSPPVTLWYADGQSVQRISVSSVEIQ